VNRKVGFISIVLTLAAVGSLLAMLPVFAATGTISLDKAYITTPNGVVTVTMADADLEVGVAVSGETTNALTSAAYTVAAGTFVVRTQIQPILDATADGLVNFADVTLSNSGLSVLDVSPASGNVTIVNNSATVGATFTTSYTAAGVQTASVTITSTQDSTGFSLLLNETGSNTGSFTGTFKTTTSTSSTTLASPVSELAIGIDLNDDGDATDTAVTQPYSEVDAGADLNNDGDATDTGLTVVDVAGIVGATSRPAIAAVRGSIITATYDDGGTNRVANSTVETTKPSVTIVSPANDLSTRTQATRLIAEVTDSDAGVDTATAAFNIVTPSSGVTVTGTTTTTIAGGIRMEGVLTGIGSGTTAVAWNVTASDNAGNAGQSDQDTDDADYDNHTLTVDTVAPAFGSPIAVETGHYFADDALVIDATTAKNTSIRVIFNEDLDGSTVAAGDFTVDGFAPAAAEWFSGAPTDVFLTVAAMASDAKPAVAMSGTIGDEAGNTVSALAAQTGLDGIAPALAVTTNASLDKASVTIDITSDEPLLTAPTLTINGGSTGFTAAALVSTNLYRSTATPTDTTNAYAIKVSVTDTSANTREVGHDDAANEAAVVFEIDSAIPAPTIKVDNASPGTVQTTKPFIEIDWTAEGSEYTNDSHGEVTLTAVTLDAVDVAASVNKEATAKYLLATSGLALGEHKLVVTGQDDAGNSSEVEATFTVAEKSAFSIPLNPGWNLISVPGALADSAINTVIDADHSIGSVLTYDPSSAGGWLLAERGSDGSFAGSLANITATRAYWVHTSSFSALSVDVAGLQGGAAALPPVINLVKGWNLVPVLDVGGSGTSAAIGTLAVHGTTGITASTYVTATKIYEYDPRTGDFTAVASTGVLGFGRGYWIYAASAGPLVP